MFYKKGDSHVQPFDTFPTVSHCSAALEARGTAIVIWFEEIAIFAQDILALIFLPILAGAVYLLDIFIFRSRMPRREDLNKVIDKGAKK